jgi:hypothetical protein
VPQVISTVSEKNMSLHQHVNNSGFALQLAIANLVKENACDWEVLYDEHEWESDSGSGFIDLVIEDENKVWLMNIECKRVRDTQWIFLKDKSKEPVRKHAKLWITTKDSSENVNHFGWVDIAMSPGTVQSSYCVVPGQDAKARPMLERIAADVVKSTEALALEETKTLSNYYSHMRVYQNVIVTTAELYVCETDVGNIDITTGELGDDSQFTLVPYVRFRKQVGAIDTNLKPADEKRGLKEQITSKESTVFIVNSSHFEEFLAACDLPDRLPKSVNR